MTCVLMGGLLAVWVNRFANAGEAAVEAAGNTMEKVQLFFFSYLCRSFVLQCWRGKSTVFLKRIVIWFELGLVMEVIVFHDLEA